MKKNVIDVLMFLFDNYLNTQQDMPEDEALLGCELEEAGFEVDTITQAFHWLGGLGDIEMLPAQCSDLNSDDVREFQGARQMKLDAPCRGFLHRLEQVGMVDATSRELIMSKVRLVAREPLTLEQFKRVVGLVMLSKGIPLSKVLCLEPLIYEEVDLTLH